MGDSNSLIHVIFWYHGHVKNEKPCNCLSTIPRASKFGRVLAWVWRIQPSHVIIWSCGHVKNLKNFYLHFNNIYCSQIWQSRGLGWGTSSPKLRKRLTKWLHDHCLLNVFKVSVAIILKILSLLSVVLRFIDNKMILMRFYLIFISKSL